MERIPLRTTIRKSEIGEGEFGDGWEAGSGIEALDSGSGWDVEVSWRRQC